jgi:hypothetical protein
MVNGMDCNGEKAALFDFAPQCRGFRSLEFKMTVLRINNFGKVCPNDPERKRVHVGDEKHCIYL